MKNDPAFPLPEIRTTGDVQFIPGAPGISRLEYFAAAALPEAIRLPAWDASPKLYAQVAFDIAEAMCAEAEKRRKE